MNSSSLTTQTPWKEILSFTTPVLLGLLLQPLYNTVDTLIVGNFLGEASLAAVDACGALTRAFLALANGCSAEVGILIAQRFGGNRVKLSLCHAFTFLWMCLSWDSAYIAHEGLESIPSPAQN